MMGSFHQQCPIHYLNVVYVALLNPPKPLVQQPLMGQCLLTVEAVRSRSDTLHSVGLLL